MSGIPAVAGGLIIDMPPGGSLGSYDMCFAVVALVLPELLLLPLPDAFIVFELVSSGAAVMDMDPVDFEPETVVGAGVEVTLVSGAVLEPVNFGQCQRLV